MFPTFDGSVSFPKLEQQILDFWKDRRIYEKSLAAREGCPEFVFYEGPPTANGLPHPGHCLTRAIKDLFPRYRTMRGQLCRRKAGWDTHGLPVEVEVCKELGYPQQRGNRGLRRRAVHPQMRRERLSLHPAVGGDDRAARLLDSPG
jgi:isoleucyl-tRNA synthetase